ncbi:MAG: leucine-rich repeat domain-containing protein [Eubacterium sp.]|nr:leucine-rich repeat domain-containing protein [Eubacterium sp.]
MQEFFFKRVDNGTFSAIEYNGDEANVVVPEKYAGQPVTVLYDRLFKGHEEITSIWLPDTITDIGAFVFDGCSSLKEVSLPEKLLYLWQYAFCRSSIEEITLPSGVRTIAPYTFKECINLRRIICNSGLIEIKARAFEGCRRDLDIVHGGTVEISPMAWG